MQYTIYELVWFFFLYSFLGWLAEVVFAALQNKKFSNRGFLGAPFCPVYGWGMLFLLIFFQEIMDNVLFLFIGSFVVTTLLEFLTGKIMEKLYGRKWWDYSDYKYNIGGYVCLQFSLIWSLGAVMILEWLHPVLYSLVLWIPKSVGCVLQIVLSVLLLLDAMMTTGSLIKLRKQGGRIPEIVEGMHKFSWSMGNTITKQIQKRMTKAFPVLRKDGKPAEPIVKEKEETVFAKGCCFHKLVWLFIIGSFLGDITETIFCLITTGELMSRSSVIYGPFSIVWGLGIVLMTMLLDRYKDKDDRYIFIFGTIVGGVYEYVCSVFTELAFGTVFWDYSKIPFNLGGRINLLYCFFWGIAALVWLKRLYPFLSSLIEKVPKKWGAVLSYVFVVFMIFNMAISALALARYSERAVGEAPSNAVEQFMDEHYTDERMERIYPNAKMTAEMQ